MDCRPRGERSRNPIAIDAGVDSIEHGNNATDQQLELMREKGMFIDITPTFWSRFYSKITGPITVRPPISDAELRASAGTKGMEILSRVERSLAMTDTEVRAGGACSQLRAQHTHGQRGRGLRFVCILITVIGHARP
jgi:hypothetical protein